MTGSRDTTANESGHECRQEARDCPRDPDAASLGEASERLDWNYSDAHNGRRLAIGLRGKAIFVPGRGWGQWTGTHFSIQPDNGFMLPVASDTLERMLKSERDVLEARLPPTPGVEQVRRLKALDRAIRDAGMVPRVNAAMKAAQRSLSYPPTEVDAAHHMLVCENGVIDLEAAAGGEVELAPHDPELRNTRRPAVAYDPNARCPGWLRFLRLALPDSEAISEFQRLLGYTLCGGNRDQIVIVLLGRGGNGKSTVANALRAVLRDYAQTCRIELFVELRFGGGQGATPEEAEMPGSRVWLAGEPEQSATLSAGKIKSLTGGEPRQARRNYKDPFIWMPAGVPILSFNRFPDCTDNGEGLFRRIKLVEFTNALHCLPVGERMTVSEVREMLRHEAPGILNWMIEGWRQYRRCRFASSARMRRKLAALRSDMDSVGAFLEACVERSISQSDRIPKAELFGVYCHFCEQQATSMIGRHRFNSAVRENGYECRKSSRMYWEYIAWSGDPETRCLVEMFRTKGPAG